MDLSLRLQFDEISSPSRDQMLSLAELRAASWKTRDDTARPLKEFLDSFDETAIHWVARDGSTPVAAARMSVHDTLCSVPDSERFSEIPVETCPGPIASFNRLVVLPDARRHGLPREFDILRLRTAQRMGCKAAIGATSAGPKRIAGMESVGFTVYGLGKPSTDVSFLEGIVPTILICRFADTPEAKEGSNA